MKTYYNSTDSETIFGADSSTTAQVSAIYTGKTIAEITTDIPTGFTHPRWDGTKWEDKRPTTQYLSMPGTTIIESDATNTDYYTRVWDVEPRFAGFVIAKKQWKLKGNAAINVTFDDIDVGVNDITFDSGQYVFNFLKGTSTASGVANTLRVEYLSERVDEISDKLDKVRSDILDLSSKKFTSTDITATYTRQPKDTPDNDSARKGGQTMTLNSGLDVANYDWLQLHFIDSSNAEFIKTIQTEKIWKNGAQVGNAKGGYSDWYDESKYPNDVIHRGENKAAHFRITAANTFSVIKTAGDGLYLSKVVGFTSATVLTSVEVDNSTIEKDTANDDELRVKADGINTAQIADNAVKADQIQNGSVSTLKLASSAVTSSRIANDAVTTAKIDDGAVTTAKIDNGAVVGTKIANGAVGNTKLANNSVRLNHIRDNNVTTSKIQNDAVTTAKINDDAVTTAKIDDDAITTVKINDEAVTLAKLEEDLFNDGYVEYRIAALMGVNGVRDRFFDIPFNLDNVATLTVRAGDNYTGSEIGGIFTRPAAGWANNNWYAGTSVTGLNGSTTNFRWGNAVGMKRSSATNVTFRVNANIGDTTRYFRLYWGTRGVIDGRSLRADANGHLRTASDVIWSGSATAGNQNIAGDFSQYSRFIFYATRSDITYSTFVEAADFASSSGYIHINGNGSDRIRAQWVSRRTFNVFDRTNLTMFKIIGIR